LLFIFEFFVTKDKIWQQGHFQAWGLKIKLTSLPLSPTKHCFAGTPGFNILGRSEFALRELG